MLDFMLEAIRIIMLLAFAALYAYFDLFNKRSIPNAFVYLSLVIGLVSTFFYPLKLVGYSLLIAIFIVCVGYLLYKAGFLGLGDGLELAFLSLMLPIQPKPLINIPQLGMPFILSVFIASGVIAMIVLPIYHLLKGKNIELDLNSALKAVTVFISYLILLTLIYFILSSISLIATIFIIIIAVFSATLFLFEKSMNEDMITWVYPNRLAEDDIIATNLMKKSERKFFKSKYKGFGRLVDKKTIAALKNINKKLPVYTNAIPFSLFILFGVIMSLLIGNPILLIFYS